MAEAASLSVSINGDASGLLSAAATAQSALAALSASAGKIVSEFGGKDMKISLSAADKTSAGVASARANINSLRDRTVTVTVKYNTVGMPKLADGTRNARAGLAMVNDERGVSDPRELIEHNGNFMMFGGRDVIVPLSSGDKVYTAAQTKAILGRNIPHYASGKDNEWFELEKAELTHYKKTHDMSPAEELRWWNELMEQFAYDSNVVREIQEEIFDAQQRVWKEEKKASESALSSYKKNSDAWIKYQVEVNDMGVDEQIEAYERQLENYNAMVSQMVTSSAYSAEEIKAVWDDFYEYKAGVDLKIGKLEKEKSYGVYKKWQSDAENWKEIRDTYGDWYEAGDSPVKFYERSIERIQGFYDSKNIGWQEYRDDTMDAKLNLYKAKMDSVDQVLNYQKNYIRNLKQQFSNEEKELSTSWEVSDRDEDIADVSHQLGIYKNAVTQRGMDKYKSLQEQMKKLQREEEMYRLEQEHTATITKLEADYNEVETNKKYMIAALENSGINIEGIVAGINMGVQNMESSVTNLLSQAVNAIKSIKLSSSSYSDNRNISINASSSDIVDALKNRVGLTIAHSKYT